MAKPATPGGPINRSDIQAKLEEIKGEVDETASTAKPFVLAAGIAIAVGVVTVAYLMGKRRGRKKTTIVEVKRV
jgi:hypothetical protein